MGRARAGLLVVTLGLLSGCGIAHPQNLNYRTDDRLEFTSPDARSLVSTPLTIRWRIRDFEVRPPGSGRPSRDAGYFAIFVDRAPIKPAETMRAIASEDQECLRRAGCPDAAYLADRRVYTTTASGLTIDQIPALPGVKERIQMHAITVVLMNSSGRRIGESAWQLDVRLRKAGL